MKNLYIVIKIHKQTQDKLQRAITGLEEGERPWLQRASVERRTTQQSDQNKAATTSA